MNTEPLRGLDPFDIFDLEAGRLDTYFSGLDDAGWERPSACRGWSVRDVLGHLAGEELYNHACLDDDLQGLFVRLDKEGVTDMNSFNEWCVQTRRSQPVTEVLEEWRRMNGETRRRMRERGADGTLVTMVGPYPVGPQTFHLDSELATHGDDVGAPAGPQEEPGRTDWRARVGIFALSERENPPDVAETPDGYRVTHDGVTAGLTPAEFVQATVARLPADHPLDRGIRSALACLA